MHVERQFISDATKCFPSEFYLYGFGKRTVGRSKRKPVKMVHMNIGNRGLVTTAVLVSKVDPVMST